MKRTLTLATALLAICIGGAGRTSALAPDPARPTPTAQVRPVPGLSVDVNTFTPADAEAVLALGIRHLRMGAWMDWWGEGQASTLARALTLASRHGLRVMISTTAVSKVCTWQVTRDCTAKVAAWHADLVRNRPAVEGVEVLNETNGQPPFHDHGGEYNYEKGVLYSRILCAVRDSVKAINPNLRVVTGALGSPPSRDNLRGLRDGGGLACADAIVFHAYGFPASARIAEQLAIVRQYTAKPVWVTEFGGQNPDDAGHARLWSEGYANTTGVVRLYGFALRAGDWGILRPDGTRRPAYEAIRRQLDPARR